MKQREHRSQQHRRGQSPQEPQRLADASPPPPVPYDDSELMESILEGIGQMTVTMKMDDGGRWRIKWDEQATNA